MHETYGIDTDDPAICDGRSWRWLRARIVGLLGTESRTHRVIFPDN